MFSQLNDALKAVEKRDKEKALAILTKHLKSQQARERTIASDFYRIASHIRRYDAAIQNAIRNLGMNAKQETISKYISEAQDAYRHFADAVNDYISKLKEEEQLMK